MFRAALISMFLTSTALADTWTVDDDGKADFDNIQAAVDASSDGDEIVVMPGTYTSTADEVVYMNGKSVWLHSTDGPESTIIDGEDARRGIHCYGFTTDNTIIEGLTVINGHADRGGGIYFSGTDATLKNCTITSNTATGTSQSYGGGGIYLSGDCILDDCTIKNNSANNSGGGIFCLGNSSPTMSNCTIESNTAHGGGNYVAGGGIYYYNLTGNSSTPTMIDCMIVNNTTTDEYGHGGGIACYSISPTLIGCTIEHNNAKGEYSYGGGIYCTSNSSPILGNCTISNNNAGYWGGGISCWYSSNLIASLCTIQGNTASDGGGITAFKNCNLTLNSCTVSDNTANGQSGGSDGYGGGMLNYNTTGSAGGSNPTLTDCTFTGNTANADGGGMFNGRNITTTLTNCIFENNIANGDGGGMFNGYYTDTTVGSLTNCTFRDNIANIDGDGGAIANLYLVGVATNCKFLGNIANGNGGAIENLTGTLTNSIFADNYADGNGGGINNYGKTLTLENCTFTNNTADEGGGIWQENCIATLVDCTASGNSATSNPKLTGNAIHSRYSDVMFDGINTLDDIYVADVANNQLGILSFFTHSVTNLISWVIHTSDSLVSFDIDELNTPAFLSINDSGNVMGGLSLTNDSSSLMFAILGDIIPLAQAADLTGNFDSIVFPLMPDGLGLQLKYTELRGGGSELAAEVIEVDEANFGDPFSGDLDSPPIDIISFDADGDGRDEVAVLFGGTPGGVACYSVSEDGTPTLIDGYAATLGDDPVDLDTGDLNGDGLDDLLVVDGESATLSILVTEESGGSLTFVESTFKGSDTFTCVAMIDWGGDSALDAVVGVTGSANGYQIYFDVSLFASIGPWLGIPNYQFPDNSYVSDPPTCVDGGNQTGDWGFVGGTRYGRVHRGTSGGSLQVISELGGNNTVTIEAIELDEGGGDGQIDLMVSSDEAKVIYLFQGNAAEADGFDDLIPLGVSLPVEDIIALDADGDGDKDIVMTAPDSTSSPLALLRNDGAAGGFVGSLTGITWSMQNINTKTSPVKVASGNLDDKGEDDDYIIGSGSSTAFRGEPTGTLEQSNILLGPQCDADVSGDGEVNVTDLLAVIDQWGLDNSPADINDDGIVDVSDLLIVVGNWGECE